MSARLHPVLLAVAVWVAAGQALADPPSHADLYGDSLPDGAVLRLGTARLKSSASQMLFTPDGRTLITLEGGRIVKRWNAEDGAVRQTFTLPEPCRAPVTLSPDGSRFAGGDAQQGVTIWDVASGNPVCHVPSGVCGFAAFSPDGATLATNAMREGVRLWDARTGVERPSSPIPLSPNQTLFSPDGSRLALMNWGVITCVDTGSGKETWRLDNLTAEIAFSPVGGALAARTWLSRGDGTPVKEDDSCEVRFIRAADGKPADRDPLACPPKTSSMRYSPDGSALAFRTPNEIYIYDLKTDKLRCKLPLAAANWSGNLFAFAPDGKTLTALAGRTLHRWDLSTGKDLYPDVSGCGHNGDVDAVAWSADGKSIATMSQSFETGLVLWDAATGKLLRRLPAPMQQRDPPRCWLAFTPDGRLLTAGDDNVAHCWEPSTGKEIWSATAPGSDKEKAPLSLERLHLTADGKRLIAVSPQQGGSADSAEKIVWDAATGELIQRTAVSPMTPSDAFSRDGRRRVVWTGQVFDEQTDAVRQTLEGAQSLSTVGGLDVGDFSPDGAFFAAMPQNWDFNAQPARVVSRGLQVWEAATGKAVRLIPNHECGRLVFSPDGRTIAVVGEDAVRVWDAVSGEEVYRRAIPSHAANPWHDPAAFSPDGRRLAVACRDTTTVVWDLSSIPRRHAPAKPLTAGERDALWNDLAADDAVKAYAAIDRLAAHPDEAPALLRDRLRPAAALPADRIKRLIAALDDDDFDAREAASKQLAEMGERVESALLDALTRKEVSAEQRSRIERVLASLPAAPPPSETLRGIRAVRALAWAGTPDARAVLEKLADGAAGDPLTCEARAALTGWTKEKQAP